MIKGFIFEFEGVLVDLEKTHFEGFKETLEDYSVELNDEDFKKYFAGKSVHGMMELLQDVVRDRGLSTNDVLEVMREEKMQASLALLHSKYEFYRDAVEFIHRVKLGNVTLKNLGSVEDELVFGLIVDYDKTTLQEVLKSHDLADTFEVIVTPIDYPNAKPHPDCYTTTLAQMKLKAEEVVGIEATPLGIVGMNLAGITSVGVTTLYSAKAMHEAKVVTESLCDLIS
jgi:beta-phosphoglucomutase-like phosphatase (HAD superfamily)